MLSYTHGRWADAERNLRAALVRDPLNTVAIYNLGTAYYFAGRYADSECMYRRLLELAPGFLWTRGVLAKTLLVAGNPDAALKMAQSEIDEEWRALVLPIFLHAVGREAEADAATQAQIAHGTDTHAYLIAMTYANRGDHDLALQWLERAYRQNDPDLVEIVGEHLFKNIAGDPRFKAFLRNMKLPA
jgi:tetratricopeptide (TPR) repeat protein